MKKELTAVGTPPDIRTRILVEFAEEFVDMYEVDRDGAGALALEKLKPEEITTASKIIRNVFESRGYVFPDVGELSE